MYHLENNSAYLTLFPQWDTYHLYRALLELVEFGFYCFGLAWFFLLVIFFFPFKHIYLHFTCLCLYMFCTSDVEGRIVLKA